MPGDLTLRTLHSLADVDRDRWDAVANPGWVVGPTGALTAQAPAAAYNPFVSHDFLMTLEEAGCAVGRTGWGGCHLLAEDAAGDLVGAIPAYAKSHSMGEYVFDHGWADAYERAGGRYYPKLQVSVPFTPVTGPRLLLRPDLKASVRPLLARSLKQVARQLGVSSVHVTFAEEEEAADLEAAGFLTRIDQQFHFANPGYGSYDDFLAELASRKRKALKKERREALENGITVEQLTGRDITEAHWDAFYAFYMDTGARKWGRPYLNRTFFSLIGERMADRTLLVMAKRNGRHIAGALNFIGSDALYGRNWGCIEDHPYLHFEVCYHQAIDFAIAEGLKRVEAGAQGAHKLARGYLPVTTRSAHHIGDPSFRRAVADFLRRERAAVSDEAERLTEQGPFRKVEVEEQE
ncbi:GNAT family N-acetyltransferase [Chthonobacter rhizosphaerae]|uniref:GNAT family N-acetyltransferase n=1 Tax=Chthonobacter rhizosphaerae TaxID=2735553 RepID=UPI0015EE441D|nr:GNAT family N-acetyltransferase [Chthonobacter rhizosphaerae]